MTGFTLKTAAGHIIRFRYYTEAPITATAFDALPPFTRTFMHERISGQEIWTDRAPELNIIQENASVFTIPGELVYGPSMPLRSKTRNAMGIYYGEGKRLYAGNIFATVVKEDIHLPITLGEQIWKGGVAEITFERSED